MLVEDVSPKEEVSSVDQNIISLDVAEPTLFLIKIFVNGLTTFVYRYGFAGSSICLLEILLAWQPLTSAEGHQNLLVDKCDSTFDKGELILTFDVVQSLHNEVFLVLKVMHPIAKKPLQLLPQLRLMLFGFNPINYIRLLVSKLRTLLKIFDQIAVIILLQLRRFKGNIM